VRATQIRYHLNIRAVTVLGALGLILALGLFLVGEYQGSRVLDNALNQVKKFNADAADAKRPEQQIQARDLALRHVSQYLASRPDDAEALEIQAKLLLPIDWRASIPVYEHLLRVKDLPPRIAQDARRNLTELYISQSMLYLRGKYARLLPEKTAEQLRFHAAEVLADQWFDRENQRPAEVAENLEISKKAREAKDPAKAELAMKAAYAEGQRLRTATMHRLLAAALENQVIESKTFRSFKDKDGKTVTIDLVDYAVREYQAALEIDPKDARAASYLADLYKDKKKDRATAVRVLDDLLAADPKSVLARLVRYRFFKTTGEDSVAAGELKLAAEQAPDNVDVIVRAASEALQGHQPDPALARQWIEKLPKSSRDQLSSLEGLIDYLQQDRMGAVSTWSKGLERSGGNDKDLTFQLAFVMLELGRDAQAEELVEQYRRLAGDDAPRLHWLKALQDERAGHYGLAVGRLLALRNNKLVDADIKGKIPRMLGRCQEAHGNRDDAEATYREGLRLTPGSIPLRLSLAQLLLSGRKSQSQSDDPIKDAINLLEQGIKSHPDTPELLIAVVRARLHQQILRPAEKRNWVEFDAAYKRAVAVSPTSPLLAQDYAERLTLANQTDQAIGLLKEATNKSPKSAELAIDMARVLSRQGHLDQALQVIEQAMDPKAAGDRGNLRTERAQILANLGRAREALAGLVRNLDAISDAERDEVWNKLVSLYQAYDDRGTVRDTFKEWARQQPHDPRPRVAMVELDIATHKDEETIAEQFKALDSMKSKGDLHDRFDDILIVAEASELLWKRSLLKGTDTSNRESLLKQAEERVDRILANNPSQPRALLMKGHLFDLKGDTDKAITAYWGAWDRGTPDALVRLADILTRPNLKRPNRKQEIDDLRRADPTSQVDQVVAMAYIRNQDPTEALRIIDESIRDHHDASPWQIEIYNRLGSTDKAVAALRALAEKRPEILEPWLTLLRYQATHGRAQAAEQTIAEIKKKIATDLPELVEAQYRMAVNDLAGADKAIDEALHRFPDDRKVLLGAAQYFETRGRNDRAEACRKHAVERDPSDRTAALQLAMTLSARPESWSQALELLGPETPSKETPEDRLARGVVLARSPDRALRQAGIEKLDALWIDLPTASNVAIAARDYLVRCLLALGNPEKAARIAEISARTSSDPAAKALYVETLLQNKQFDIAETQLDQLAKIDPANAFDANFRVRLVQGRSFQKGEQAREFAAKLEQLYLGRESDSDRELIGREVFPLLLAKGPPDREAAERVGRRMAQKNPALSWMPAAILAGRGARKEALDLCLIAAQAATDSGDLRQISQVTLDLAVNTSAESSALERAQQVIDAALSHTPDADNLLVVKAMLEHLQGHYDREVRLYRTVLPRQPRSALLLNNLAWALSEGMDQPSDGLEKIDDLIRFAGRQPENLDTRGVILNRLGRPQDAVKDLEEAVKAEPTGSHLYHLALVYKKMDRIADFRKTLEAAKRAGLTAASVDLNERAELEALMNH
jgi:cellulose synthase operon protein C